MNSSKERAIDLFFKSLNIEHPTPEQKRSIEMIDEASLSKPVIKQMIDQNRTSGEIANKLRIKERTATSRIQRIKKQYS